MHLSPMMEFDGAHPIYHTSRAQPTTSCGQSMATSRRNSTQDSICDIVLFVNVTNLYAEDSTQSASCEQVLGKSLCRRNTSTRTATYAARLQLWRNRFVVYPVRVPELVRV